MKLYFKVHSLELDRLKAHYFNDYNVNDKIRAC